MCITKAHIGCTVRRKCDSYSKAGFPKMEVGDTDVVVGVTETSVELKYYGGGHSKNAFELGIEEPLATHGITPQAIVESHLVKGDTLRCIKSMPGIAVGDTAKFKGYDNDGDLTLTGFYGAFLPENWEFVETKSDPHLHDLSPKDLPELEEGDIVMMLQYGWGIGDFANAKAPLGVPVEVTEVQSTTYYALGFSHPEVSRNGVNRKAIRLLKKAPKAVPKAKSKEEAPMKHKCNIARGYGIVKEYKGLSTPRTIIEQQSHAQKVLTNFRAHIKTQVFVCGGAPRNWDNDKLANDIDVYFYVRGNNLGARSRIAAALGLDVDDLVQLGSDKPYYGQEGIRYVFQVELAGLTYQFIVTDKPIEDYVDTHVLRNFNCDFCKIAWNPLTDTYVKTSEYKTDKEFKRLTYRMYDLDPHNAKLSWQRHVPKMVKQFPDHDLYIMRNPTHGGWHE